MPSARELGYDAQWDRLSKRARRMQPFCIDCGSTEDYRQTTAQRRGRTKPPVRPSTLWTSPCVAGPATAPEDKPGG